MLPLIGKKMKEGTHWLARSVGLFPLGAPGDKIKVVISVYRDAGFWDYYSPHSDIY